MNKKLMKNYAKLVVKVGLNLQKGQDVEIIISPRNAEFARCLVEECYRAKARKVDVDFQDDVIKKLKFKHQSVATLSKFEKYEEEKF
jgi:aminopeptidase